MSTYPSLRVSSETPNESWRQIPQLDPYFLVTDAEDWHPEDFERNTTHTDLNVFLHGLADISRCRLASVSTYAGDILRYLSTTAGEELKKEVREKLELRAMAYSNQLSYSKLQTQYSTENYLYLLDESKRKHFLDNANGSSSAPATSTPVPLRRGRASRKRTTSVAVPAAPAAPALNVHEVAFDNVLSRVRSELEESGKSQGVVGQLKKKGYAATSTVLKRGRNSQKDTAHKAARRTASKTTITEPWHSLIETGFMQ
ncbi:hypothetical protein BGX26_006961, partial [Mortierella sp. AD094]